MINNLKHLLLPRHISCRTLSFLDYIYLCINVREEQLLGSRVDHPSEEQKDTHDNVSHKARFISSQLGSGYPPDAVGLNRDPEYKTQAAFIFF
jgi:hypothetical protein